MNRYPGIRPFTAAERPLFFGRNDDIERLLRLIRLENVVILYGKSGYGKSSLLQAGVLPRLRETETATLFEVRLGPYKPPASRGLAGEGGSLPPVQTLLHAVLPEIPGEAPSGTLWLALKNHQLRGEGADFLLCFDQFEELFSYPDDQILAFKQQLAEALYALMPDQYGRSAPQEPAERAAFFTPFTLKVVFSIRSDRVALLNGLKSHLPNLLQHTYELDALDEGQAEEAIVAPAGLGAGLVHVMPSLLVNLNPLSRVNPTPNPSPEGEGSVPSDTLLASDADGHRIGDKQAPLPFGGGVGGGVDMGEGTGIDTGESPKTTTATKFSTPPFTYAPEALQTIFTALRDERGRIETSALQIVCRHVEDNIVAPRAAEAQQVITSADLGELHHIFRDFYENTLAALPAGEQSAARRLCEDVLISPEGVRLPFAGQALAGMGFAPGLLDALTRASLLRVERDDQGRMLYEVGHDTLVAPIVAAAKARREREEKERLQRETEEAKRREAEAQRKQRRAYLLTAGAVLLALFAVGASYFAYLKSEEAGRAAAIILEKEKQVEQNVQIAANKTQLADAKSREAAEALQRADEKEAEAKRNLEAVQREKTATAEQKHRAAEALELARQERVSAEIATTGIVQKLIENAEQKIYHLDYAGAVTQINAAYDLVADRSDDSPLANYRDVVADALLEMAYYYTETGQYLNARYELVAAGKLFGQHFPELWTIVTIDQPGNGDKLTQALQGFRPMRYQALEARYYPDMVAIPAGEFLMGRDTAREPEGNDGELPRHLVRLSAFSIARTETTIWQYGLFCQATGGNINQFHESSWGGIRGDDPVINVSWYDAALYTNWLSERKGLQPAYVFSDTTGQEQISWQVSIDSTARGYRLPTEAQWEYAARSPVEGTKAGSGVDHIYSGSDDPDAVAWYFNNGSSRTHPVAKKSPNAYGLYDMSGNVWEWCNDWYDGKYYDNFRSVRADNPPGPPEGQSAVLRGGAWYYYSSSCRVAVRNNGVIRFGWNYYIGFRCARAAPEGRE